MPAAAGRPRDGGFTLVEVMIALFFLSFMVAEMAMLSIHATRSSTYAQRLTRASMIAEAVVEASRNTAFDKLKTQWCVDANGNNSCDGGEPTETICFDANGNGSCDAGDPAPAANQPTTFTWGYDIMNGALIPAYFTRSRTVQYQSTGLAGDSYTADVNVLVSWNDTRGQTQQVRLASVVSKY
jgi:Tfp pilus assembly protein PilV